VTAFIGYTHVDQHLTVTTSQVVQHAGVVQEGQVGHILGALKLGRIHLLGEIFFQSHLKGRRATSCLVSTKLSTTNLSTSEFGDRGQVTFDTLDLSGNISLFRIRNPDGLFAVISFEPGLNDNNGFNPAVRLEICLTLTGVAAWALSWESLKYCQPGSFAFGSSKAMVDSSGVQLG